MIAPHAAVELQHPFNLAIRRGETLKVEAASKREGKRRLTIRRSRGGVVNLDFLDYHGDLFQVKLSPAGEKVELLRPAPIDALDTEIMVPLILQEVETMIRGALMEDNGVLIAPWTG